jgi:hypothetical protein
MKLKLSVLLITKCLGLVTVLGILGSCMKKPDHTPDYGPEVPLSDIQKASETGIPPIPDVIKKDQKISIDWFRVIQTNSPVTFYQRADQVTMSQSKVSSDGGPGFCWTFSVKQRQLDFNSNTWKEAIDLFGPLSYPSPDLTDCTGAIQPSSFRISIQPLDLRSFTLKGLAAQEQSAQPKVKYSYHRLVKEEGTMPLLPALVQNPNWCGRVDSTGKPLCPDLLRFVKIGFDRVTRQEGQKDVKVTYRFTYSSDIPTYVYDWQPGEVFLTNQLESCVQMWVEVKEGENAQNVPLRECMQVTDFQFGK